MSIQAETSRGALRPSRYGNARRQVRVAVKICKTLCTGANNRARRAERAVCIPYGGRTTKLHPCGEAAEHLDVSVEPLDPGAGGANRRALVDALDAQCLADSCRRAAHRSPATRP